MLTTALAFLTLQQTVWQDATTLCKKDREATRRFKVIRIVKHVASRSMTRTAINLRREKGNFNLIMWIIKKESTYNPKCTDSRSTSYGLAGFLNMQWRDFKVKRTSNPIAQVELMFRYIDKRYKGDPYNAYRFWKRNGWY